MQNWQSLLKSSRAVDQALKKALLISIAVHLALFIFLPGYLPRHKETPASKRIPVELVTIKTKEPIPKRKTPRPKPRPKPKYTPKPKQTKGAYKSLVSEYVKELSQQAPAELALPDVSLPEKFSRDLPQTILPKSEELFSPEEIFTDTDITPSAGMKKMAIKDSVPKPEGTRKSPLHSDTGIEWKGKPRKTKYKPPLPKISSKVEGDVQIKFWVDRDGRVSQMIPMKKLDAELESIALDYLKKWRFESLPRGENFLQWGIITIKIRLE